MPVAFDLVTKIEQYLEAKTKKSKRKSSITKNERYRMLLRVAVHNQVTFKYVLNDVWVASSENMKFIKHQLGREFVMPLKENRQVARTPAEKKLGHYVAVNTLELTSGATQQFGLQQWISHFLRPKKSSRTKLARWACASWFQAT